MRVRNKPSNRYDHSSGRSTIGNKSVTLTNSARNAGADPASVARTIAHLIRIDPRLCIITTSCNRWDLIRRLLPQLERQRRYVNLAWIIIDNGSRPDHQEGALTVPQFKEIFQPLDARKHQIKEEIPRVEAEIDLLKIDHLSSDHIMSEARDIHSRWPSMPGEDRRKIVELLVKDITIGKGEIDLNLYYLPGCTEMTFKQRTL